MNKDNTPMNENKTSAEHEENIIEPSILDEQWAELSQDWQAQPYEKTDVKVLLSKTKRRTLWAKTCFALNVVATVGLLISFIYGVIEGEFGDPFNTYLGAGGLISLVFVYYEIKIRASTWSKISDSPDQALENALAGCESSMEYMILTKWSCLPFTILANWLAFTLAVDSEKSMVSAFILINALLLLIYAITEFIHRKRKNEYQQLLLLQSELKSDE